MRRCLAAFVTLSFIAAANVSAADIPFPGSTVFIPPLLNENSPAEIPPSTRVMRLPPQAGLVRNVITTNLLKKGPSWIAFGDKYISLCAPNRLRVACSPVAATATMRDIHIRAYAGGNNEAYVAYDVRPKTTRSAAEVFVATDYFQKRLAKKVAHFNRMATVYVPPPPRTSPPPMRPSTDPKKVGIAPMLIAEVGGVCVYDDFGDLDCTGGNAGNEATGVDADVYDWTLDAGWEEPEDTTTTLPSFPIGTDSPSNDPCTGPDGTNVCQQINITGQRPNTDGCLWSPVGRVCTIKPPLAGGDPLDELPPPTQPWFSQDMCNMLSVFCTKGQIQDNERIPVGGDGVSYEDKAIACQAMYEFEMDECKAYSRAADVRMRIACQSKAADRNAECLTTARRTNRIAA